MLLYFTKIKIVIHWFRTVSCLYLIAAAYFGLIYYYYYYYYYIFIFVFHYVGYSRSSLVMVLGPKYEYV